MGSPHKPWYPRHLNTVSMSGAEAHTLRMATSPSTSLYGVCCVCVCVCVRSCVRSCVRACVRAYVCECLCKYVSECVSRHARIYAFTHARMHACTHARLHACTHACTHACMHACTRGRMHACTHPLPVCVCTVCAYTCVTIFNYAEVLVIMQCVLYRTSSIFKVGFYSILESSGAKLFVECTFGW